MDASASGGSGGAGNAGGTGAGNSDAAEAGGADAGGADAGGASGADTGGADAGADIGGADAGPADSGRVDAAGGSGGSAGAPTALDQHVHIYVSNTCVMRVDPLEITVPAGSTVRIDWHNHSVDYPVDVWLSYGGGYVGLPTGSTWDEPIEHCANINPYTAYADISTACSRFRFYIRCL